ncbi:MAG: choice-of-anchor J domain-containing protein [Bacteroidia bacterium]|jgi:subtilisin-like proprotein convertase family protein
MKRKLLLLLLFATFNHCLMSQVLVYEGFEGSTFPPVGWTVLNNGAGNIWAQNTTASYAASGTQSMVYTFTSSAAAAAWAFSPAIALDSADSVTITFQQRVGLANLAEALKVTVGTAPLVASQTMVLYNNNNLTNTVYTQRTATFIADSTATYYFAFNCYSPADRYKLYVDNIRIAKPVLNDAQLLTLSVPASGCALGAAEPVSVVIKNSGVDTISNFAVNYLINGSVPVAESIATAIPPGNTLLYTFTNAANLSSAGNYTIRAYTSLLNDDDPYNDTLTQHTEHIASGAMVKSSLETVSIPDNSNAGVYSPLVFCGLPNLDGTSLSLDYLRIDSISHSWISDLSIYLISPNNDSILVSASNGGGTSNIENATFTDSASINIATINTGGIHDGFYHTENPTGLAAFHTGQNPNGTWKLRVVDNETGDVGKICKWTLAFKASTSITSKGQDSEVVQVFPNPTRGTIIIDVKNKSPLLYIKVRNSSGQTLYSESTKIMAGTDMQVELEKYGKGIYLLQLISEDGVLTKKIVVY